MEGVIVQLGGQTAISLAEGLEKAGLVLYGTKQQTIDQLEDRGHFYRFMNEVDVPHIPGQTANNEADAVGQAEEIGFPVLIRPSYVIGGQGMVIFSSKEELVNYMNDHRNEVAFPLLIDAYYPGTELEVDALTDGKDVFIAGIFEHIEKAGVHSGDSIAVTPPVSLQDDVKQVIWDYTIKVARGMDFKGVFNIQFVLFEGELFVIEINPRASRTVPIFSKVTNRPLIDYTVQLLLGAALPSLGISAGFAEETAFYTVKAPVFSYQKLSGVDPLLEAEMKSTGELISISNELPEAYYKAFAWEKRKCLLFIKGRGPYLSMQMRVSLSCFYRMLKL